jgi:hypothetical protein
MTPYLGPWTYDFRADLAAALARSKERAAARARVDEANERLYWRTYYDCDPPRGDDVATPKRRRRRTTITLKEQVRVLRARGLVPRAIATALNISDRRCRALLREVSEVAK